ncbi:hypothetical protein B0H17DRAFT_1215812 [Mycena rosella]|uniref:Uncharacterized protein n=1 Tax=Mycena rosella TaxID=1033263 RepID=A0AAD7CDA8_MYCRO|nr:hypothetical protein B0H17DRAFT_1215812 [Mycena rosella]
MSNDDRLLQILQVNGTLHPYETLLSQPLSPLSVLSDDELDNLPSPPTTTSDFPETPPLRYLNEDIARCAEATLVRNEHDDLFVGLSADFEEDVPLLHLADFSDTISNVSGASAAVCTSCFDPSHDEAMDCPLWGTTASPGPVSASRISNDRGKNLGALYYLDDLILDPALIPSILLDQTREDEVQRIFDLMLGPSLEERLGTAAAAVARGELEIEGGANSRTDAEVQQVLDAALSPILDGLLELPANSSGQLRALARTALRVRHIYEEFIAGLARQEQGEAEWTTRDNVASWFITQSDSDHDSLPDLVSWSSRSPSPVLDSTPLLPPGIVVAVGGDDEAASSLAPPALVFAPTPGPFHHVVIPRSEQDKIDEAAALDFDLRAAEAEAAYSRRSIFSNRPYLEKAFTQNVVQIFLAPPPSSETPSLDFQRNKVITRELWSSSASPSTSESSFDNVEAYEMLEQAVHYELSQVPVALVIEQEPEREATPELSTFTDTESFRIDLTPPYLRAITDNAAQTVTASDTLPIITPNPFFPAFTLQNIALQQWIKANQCYQIVSICWEDDFRANDLAHLDLLATTARTQSPLTSPSLSLDPIQSPTSLDYSLPDPPAPSTFGRGTAADVHTDRHGKRKSRSASPSRPHKRLPAGLTDADVIRMLAGVRLATIEGAREVGQFVTAHYPVSELNMPSAYITHPLLTDLEAAKLHTLWNVLQHHHQYFLASLVLDVLMLRFQDKYAVSHIFNSGILQECNPNVQYWELLPFEDVRFVTSLGVIDFHTDTPPDFDPVSGHQYYEDSDMEDKELQLQYPNSEDGRLQSERYCFETESSAVFTDSSDMDSDSDTPPSIHAGPDDAEGSFYIRRVGDWFRDLDETPLVQSTSSPKASEELFLDEPNTQEPIPADWNFRAALAEARARLLDT